MASGGQNIAPILTSTTFAITQPNQANQPGIYAPVNNMLIPIGATCNLTATSPNQNNPIVSWNWSGGSDYDTYQPGSAMNPPSVPMPSPENPSDSTGSYAFIASPVLGNNYSVTVNVSYKDGTGGYAQLNFTMCEPTGTLAVKQDGSFIYGTIQGTNQLTARFTQNNNIQISMSASLGNVPSGSFMILQIIDDIDIQVVDQNGATWLLANDQTFTQLANQGNFNGPLIDAQLGQTGYNLQYLDATSGSILNAPNSCYWSLPDANGNTSVPAGNNGAPYMSDNPNYTTIAGMQSLSLSESFTDYLMFQSSLQGSVWIALSELNWSWSATTVAGQPGGDGIPTTDAFSSEPSGSAAFPPWVNTGQSLLAAGVQKTP